MMEDPACPATPPLSKCPDTPPRPGSGKSSPSKWNSSSDHKEKCRTPTPNRPSSPENCAICLGALTNKSFTNSCCHQFCYVCLHEWSKVKAECPLCKVAFDSIIYNVRSQDDYDQYKVVREEPPLSVSLASGVVWTNARATGQYQYPYRYQYRAFTEWMARHGLSRFRTPEYINQAILPVGPPTQTAPRAHTNGTSAFRQSIYDRDLWARLQPDITGRYRECSPEFYAQNPAQMHRLIPFLNRELNVLLENGARILYVMEKILELLPRHNMTSSMFRSQVAQLIGHQHAPHFCHELRAFASSPFDLVGYDRAVQYHPNGGANISVEVDDGDSSDFIAQSDDDDDVLIIETTPPRTVSRNIPSTSVSGAASTSAAGSAEASSHLPVASVVDVSSDSDSDYAEDIQIVGVVKPRHERTPEIITLSSPEHSNFPSPRITQATESSGSSAHSSNGLICINLGSSSSAVHRWQENVNEISSDDVSVSPSHPCEQFKPKTRGRCLRTVNSKPLETASSSSEDERMSRHSKHKHDKKDKKESKRKHRKQSKSKHRKNHVIQSDTDDESLPSTSQDRSNQRHRTTSSTSSQKTSNSSRDNIPSTKSKFVSGSDPFPARAVIRSAIVPSSSQSYSSRFTSDEEVEVSPLQAGGPKVRNLIVRRTTVEGHDSWNLAGSDGSSSSHRHHSHRAEQYESSHHSSKSSPSSHSRHQKHQSYQESTFHSKRRHHSRSNKDSCPKSEKKRRDRSRSPDVYLQSNKIKQRSPSFSDEELHSKRKKLMKQRPLAYSDDSDSS